MTHDVINYSSYVQPTLFPGIRHPEYSREETIEQRFRRFHAMNPHVFDHLREMALGLRRRGIRRYGIAALFEVLRFQTALQTSGDPFRLNNDYRALYARLLMESEPALRGFFETRERRSR